MKAIISQDGKYEAVRLSKQEVQVSNVKTFKSYLITTTADGFVNGCGCSYGKRPGTICPHKELAEKLVAIEQAPVVWVKPVGTLQVWLDEQAEKGIQLFA